MRIMLLFAGQGYNKADVFDVFASHPPSLEYLHELSQVAGFDLLSSASKITDPQYAQMIIGAYQLTVYQALSESMSHHNIESSGYSLGEVSAFLSSIHASPQQAMNIYAYRTKVMRTLLNTETEYDLVAVRGIFHERILKKLCEKYSCYIAIINSPDHYVVAGTITNLKLFLEKLKNQGLEKASYLSVHLPSHTPLYAEQAGRFQQYLQEQCSNQDLRFPIINPIKLGKVFQSAMEMQLLDEELYTALNWYKINQLIVEYHYDLIIDLGPGQALTQFLKQEYSTTNLPSLLTIADYKSIEGVIAELVL